VHRISPHFTQGIEMSNKIKKSSLLDETRNLLSNRPKWLTNATIAKDLDLSVGWISGVETGKIKNPGVNSIEALRDYLKETANKGA
jgi:transcriptional regulator with XRE-family HTH domain